MKVRWVRLMTTTRSFLRWQHQQLVLSDCYAHPRVTRGATSPVLIYFDPFTELSGVEIQGPVTDTIFLLETSVAV